jgi:serine/threonine-protein kinase
MATGISSRSFISVLKRSGVVSEEELNRALAAIQERGELSLDNPQALAKAMIADGIITRWQAEKLLQGKHKGFFLGPYRLLDMLGKGGMGAVYLAEHTLMRRRCAIKVLPTKNIGSRSYLERFYREAQAVAAMDHKNIVRAYDVNQAKVGEQDVHFLAMEFVEGRDLQRMVDEDGVLAYNQAAEYIRQSAEGLAHAHDANMVHRDIKPANLLVNSRGVVKILDLGLAKFYDDQQEAASLTVAHNETVLGTADYLAPEQAVDSHNTDHRADIYSLGCTFYFLLTGHPPFCEGSVANRLLHHQMKPPPPIRDDRPDVPESLLVIIDRMMAKKREERYQTAKDVADDLAVWLVENGNEEWRERNPELVRKVGDSWRADTKVVSGALVDTAELDLKADEDLSLAPLEGSETPKESPLVSSAASGVSDSELDLAPHEEPQPSKSDTAPKTESGIKGSNTKLPETPKPEPLVGLAPLELEPAAPAPVDLQPLATTDLAPLTELQSLEPLASMPIAATTNTALSGPHPTHAAAPKKKDDSFPIPMPWIIAIAAIAVVTVLAVIVMMIASSGGNDRSSAVSQGPGAVTPESSPQLTPSLPVEPGGPQEQVASANVDESPAQTQEQSDVSPPSEASPANTPPEPSPTPAAAPEAVAPDSVSVASSDTNPPPANGSPSTTPANVTPPQPANPIPRESTTPAESPPQIEDPPVEQPAISAEQRQQLLASITKVAIKVEAVLPENAGSIRDAVLYEVREKLRSAGLEDADDSSATLFVRIKAGLANGNVQFSLNAELIAVNNGQNVSLWREELADQSPLTSYRSGNLPQNLRKEIGTLFRRLSVAKKHGS